MMHPASADKIITSAEALITFIILAFIELPFRECICWKNGTPNPIDDGGSVGRFPALRFVWKGL
jgi:hypothetical protein